MIHHRSKARGKITLNNTTKILCVIPEHARGPGWANSLLWVYTLDTIDQELGCFSVQSEDITSEEWALFDTLCAAHQMMKGLTWKRIEVVKCQ